MFYYHFPRYCPKLITRLLQKNAFLWLQDPSENLILIKAVFLNYNNKTYQNVFKLCREVTKINNQYQKFEQLSGFMEPDYVMLLVCLPSLHSDNAKMQRAHAQPLGGNVVLRSKGQDADNKITKKIMTWHVVILCILPVVELLRQMTAAFLACRQKKKKKKRLIDLLPFAMPDTEFCLGRLLQSL